MPAKAGIHAFVQARKKFFFEKKNQKTFAPLRAALDRKRSKAARSGAEFFCYFFFKKSSSYFSFF
jgi:hypothetical protein